MERICGPIRMVRCIGYTADTSEQIISGHLKDYANMFVVWLIEIRRGLIMVQRKIRIVY
jgi:hypothetical protein